MKRRDLVEALLVLLGFTALSCLILQPLPWNLGRLVYGAENGDAQFSVWNVGWVARTLFHDPRHLLDANIFFPHRWTLAYSELNLLAGLIGAPAYWLSGGSAYVALNFALVASFVLAGTGMYFLCLELTGDRRAAVVGGIVFAFCPHVFGHLPHIQLLMTVGLPFSLLAFHRVLDAPSPGRGAALGVAMALQAYACAYYSVFVLVMIGFAVLLSAARGAWRSAAYWKAIAVGALVSVVLSAPLVWTMVFLQQAGFKRTLNESRMYVADWRAYLASGHLLHAWMLKHLGHWKEVLFPGILAVVLGVPAVAMGWRAGGRRREVALLYGGLGVAAAWASFGPQAYFYSALYYLVPTFSMLRAPSRFGLVVVFALGVLASMAVAMLLERRKPRVAAVLGGALIVFAVADALIPLKFDNVLLPHPAYRLLATLPDGPLLEMPVYSRALGFRRTRYMLDSTWHWKPLVDAYSDYIPPDFDARAEALANFPNLDALADMKRDNIRYVMVHLEPYAGEMREDLDRRITGYNAFLRELYRDRDLVLVEVVKYP